MKIDCNYYTKSVSKQIANKPLRLVLRTRDVVDSDHSLTVLHHFICMSCHAHVSHSYGEGKVTCRYRCSTYLQVQSRLHNASIVGRRKNTRNYGEVRNFRYFGKTIDDRYNQLSVSLLPHQKFIKNDRTELFECMNWLTLSLYMIYVCI
jgi:hypothetical protein